MKKKIVILVFLLSVVVIVYRDKGFPKEHSLTFVSTESSTEGEYELYQDEVRDIDVEVFRSSLKEKVSVITVRKNGNLVLNASFIKGKASASFYDVNGTVSEYSDRTVIYATHKNIKSDELGPEKVLFALEAGVDGYFSPMKKNDFINFFSPVYFSEH